MSSMRTELKAEISATRTDLKTDLARLDDRITVLDDRVYALAAGLRPQLQRDQPAPRPGTTGATG